MSGAVPPPAARPLERAARVPRPVCPGCGRCGRLDPAPAQQRAPLRAGVARCGGGGRASPGGVPSTVVRGAWCQALSLPRPPVLWSGLPGFRYPCVPGAVNAGVWTLHQPHSVRPCGTALLAVGVAEGRPRGGGAFHRCEGHLVSGAVPPLAARPLEHTWPHQGPTPKTIFGPPLARPMPILCRDGGKLKNFPPNLSTKCRICQAPMEPPGRGPT